MSQKIKNGNQKMTSLYEQKNKNYFNKVKNININNVCFIDKLTRNIINEMDS